MKLRLVLLLFTLAAAPAAALAQDDSLNRARAAFDEAQTLFAQQKYVEAADKFLLAYDARPFTQFLFNAGAAYEKARDYAKAVEHYRRYLKEEPKADDRAQVEKRIAVLEAERKRLESAPATPPDPADPDQPPPDPAAAAPSEAVQELGDVSIRGLIVIESEPQNAYIYLDSKRKEPVAKTPWSGSLEGEHTIFIERQGYKPVERRIAPDPSKLLVLVFTLAEEDYLGWIDIKSNIPGADIYIDDKAVGVYRKTPYSGNIKPGKHKIWVTAEGYDEYYQEIDIVAGKTHEINATLTGSPVGYLNFRGREIENTTIYLDGEILCERGPCRKPVPQGKHTIEVKRSGYKTYKRNVDVQSKTEMTVQPRLAEKPGRGDAVWAYVFAAAFAGGGVYAGLQAQSIEDELREEIDLGMPPPDPEDPRFVRGKIFAISADAAYALAGVSLLTAVYYTFRDKGPASTATTDVRAVALEPQVGPGYAGLGMEVSW